jgi:outer membrane protein OmpA-like peptidoglycan-associated protein
VVAPEPPQEPLRYVVYFGFDDAALDPAAEAVLNEARVAAEKLGGVVSVAGNADKAGGDEYNQVLSELRADAVAKYMTAEGLPHGIIQTTAYGESNPAVPTADGVPEPANRRVEILVEPLK